MSANSLSSRTSGISATVHADRVGRPIGKYVYGQFIEHLGNLINHGLWAEMLDDRKFFHPIDAREESSEDEEGPPRLRANKWRPAGPEAAVTMDAARAYAGDHSPRVQGAAREARGIRQLGLALRRGRAYTGRIVLAAEGLSAIDVALVWGQDVEARQRVSLTGVGREYTTFPLAFTAGGDSDDGRVEITAIGEGAFWVGAVSLMPADNVRGFRRDTIELLRGLDSGMYRFPGGNFVSNHDWRDAIGDPDRRPPTWDHAWNVVQPNDVGTDELIALCELLGVEPYITVNAGYGEARSAADLVEYCNGSVDTPMGALRAANGHPEPYNVKWWGIGNEMYGAWQHGWMQLEHFCIKHNMFGKAMRAKDPTITLIGSGATPEEMTIAKLSMRTTGELVPEVGSEGDWSGSMLLHCADDIDVMSEHFYCYDGQRFDLEVARHTPMVMWSGFVKADETLLEWTRRPADRVRTKVEAYQDYLERLPGFRERFVPMIIDEWAYARLAPCLKQALSYAWGLHEMFRHSDLICGAAYTFATSCIDWNGADADLNTTGMVFKFYRDHYGELPLAVSGDSPQPEPKYPVGGEQPRVSAGSPTYPLDVHAALTADRRALTVAVVNPSEEAQQLTLNVEGIALKEGGRAWRLSGPHPEAANALGQEPEVAVTESTPEGLPGTLAIPPLSASIYRIELA